MIHETKSHLSKPYTCTYILANCLRHAFQLT